MKKRYFSILLVFAMLVSFFVAPASATESEPVAQVATTSLAEQCPCGCGVSISQVEWIPYDINTKGSIESGHYYLDGDYAQDDQYTVKATEKVVLDLRGNTLTTEGQNRLYLVYGHMAVVDTVGGGRMASKATGSGNGGAMMVSKDTNSTKGGVFEAYDCILTLDDSANTALDGGFAVIADGCTFRMKGGMLLNMTGRHGGALAVRAGARIELTDAQILGCSATSNGGSIYSLGTTVLENCKIWGGVAGGYGGNICQPGGTLTVKNCEVAFGEANGTSNGGGNICTYGSTSTIENSRIYSGYTKYNGGNLFMGSGTHTLKDLTVYGGTAENSGGNLTTINSSAKLTIDNCSFTGDVRITRGTITFKNKVTIGLLNTGLNMIHTDDKTATADFSGLTDGSEIYVNANAQFTKGSANAAYFKGALRTVISETAEGLVGTQAADGTVAGYCPHCNAQVAWSAFSTTASLVQECYNDTDGDTNPTCTAKHVETGHYYMDQDYSSFIQYKVGAYRNATALASEDVVIDLNGYDLGGAYRAFYIHPGKGDVPDSTLTLLDSIGGATVTGDGSNAQGGGVVYNESSNLNIYGGIYRYKVNTSRVVKGGSVLFNSGVLNIYGGVFDGSAYENTEQVGGTVYTTSNGKILNISGGLFIGGKAKDGGTIYAGYNNNISITGGILRDGQALETGGNLRLYSSGSSYADGTLTLRDVAFKDGHATKSAGNLDIQYCTATIENCLFTGGSADSYAGNMNLAGSVKITLDNSVLLSGSAPKGGNLYTATINTDVSIKDSLLYGGKATGSSGGNYHANNARVDVENTVFAYGSATSYGGNIYANAGNASATSDNYLRLGKGTILMGGSANYGGNIAVKGVTYLDDVTILGGKATTSGRDVYLVSADKQQKLEISQQLVNGFTLYVHDSHLSDSLYGAPITNTVCNTLNAEILLENLEDLPKLIAVNGQLGLSAYCVISSDGNAAGYDTLEAAIAACDENSYVKIFTDANIALTKDCAVDLNGCTVTVSGAYTLYGMDSTGDGFTEPAGKLIAAEETTVVTDYKAPNGNRYLYLNGGFHRIDVRITDVNLRPSVDGIYYNGTWGCDDTVKALVDSYGVAVSLQNMPGADFAAETENLFTSFAGSQLVSGEKKPGAIIEGILDAENSADRNDWNAKANIFATAYLKLTDGTTLISDEAGYGDDIYFSMHTLLQTLDNLIETQPKSYSKNTRAARAFYEKWATVMASWELKKIPTPEDDGVIDLLMIGNSFCTYFTQELYAIAEAAGVKLRVCNLYYSGCSLQQHYTWWQDDSAPYIYYESETNGRVATRDVSLEWALAQHEWDVLSIQEVSSRLRNISAAEGLEMTATYRQALIPYLQERFPDATLYWQQTWAYQKGFSVSSYTVDDREDQLAYAQRQREFALAVCEEFGIPRVPTGPAWEIIRDGGYDEMCDRLGKADGDDPHAGDYYHDGDIGGGQYLNAAVWFETITGQSVIGNTYVPTYTYDGQTYGLNEGITVEELQNAAHQAVEAYRAETEQ